MLVDRFDADAHLDLVVAVTGHFTTSRVQVYPGRGDGTFAAPLEFDSAFTGEWLVAHDLDGDHDLDLVGARYFGVDVMLGNGDGTFAPATTLPVSAPEPRFGLVADVNGDTRPDLVVTRPPDVVVLPGNGDGTFGAELTSALVDNPVGLALGDFDEDGRLDVVSDNFFPVSLHVALGRGDGTFEPPQECPSSGSPHGIAVGDMDRDGHADLVTADFYQQSVSVLRGAGDGSFGLPVGYPAPYGASNPALADLNHDHWLDVVVSSEFPYEIGVLHGTGGGSLAPAGGVPLVVSLRYALGDADEDGELDLFSLRRTSLTDSAVAISFGSGSGRFGGGVHLPIPGASDLAAADANGDARDDLILANYNYLVVHPRTGPAEFGAPTYSYVPNVERMQVADLNGDASADVVTDPDSFFGGGGSMYVALGNGLAGFEPSAPYDVDVLYGLADVDGDGSLDILAHASGVGIAALYGHGDGAFDPPATLLARHPFCAGVLDLDGDGLNDLVGGTGQFFTLELFHAQPGGGFAPGPVYDLPHSAFGLAVHDVDGDGRADVVVGGSSDRGQISLLRGRADGALEAPVTHDVASFTREIAVVDFDRDGDLDLAAGRGPITVLLGDGAGNFGSRRDYGTAATLGIADLDLDGFPDIASSAGQQEGILNLHNRLGSSNRAPVCSAARPSSTELLPADGKFVQVSILGVVDPEGDPLTIQVTRVTQDEPVVSPGSLAPDAILVEGGVLLRRERAGTPKHPGNGRVYEITFTARDGRGGESTSLVRVFVPADLRGPGRAVDDGQAYDSTATH